MMVENEAFSGETFHKKNEVLKKMLEDIFNIKSMTTQLSMELEITKILNYFLDLRTDFLLTHLKTVFIDLVNKKQLFKKLETANQEDLKCVCMVTGGKKRRW